MGSICPMQNGGGFRGPPIPLVVVPVVYQLMRSNPDLKVTKYVKDLMCKGGPVSVAENAHYIIQYMLSKLPSNVIYWFGTKVLQLKPEIAMQTTEFLKSRTELGPPTEHSLAQSDIERLATSEALTIPSDVERRLAKLEMDYQMLQEQHTDSLKLLAYKTEEVIELPRELPPPTPAESPAPFPPGPKEPGQLEAPVELPWSCRPAAGDLETQALLQEIGLRLGRVVLEWAGDMMKQSLMSGGSTKFPSDSKLGGAREDLGSRLANSLTT
ncbi:hypothetical protein KVR01_006900 [Diaporthe batatas]|uniref:uncharacterized protein n=1 Tax=Diaporthe batatas TaxID=748121 RepID=UPI001D05515F|nr:uncharacterized protein KVR01_006900 [Diaporthe batatas]KAG8163603.1 hypothetical protein KVR01_006900 [Diaporthe batatas]